MKRANPYSDGYDGEYPNQKISVPTTGVFLFTRSSSRNINGLLHRDDLLTIFSRVNCIILFKASRVCKYWNGIISNPNNQNGMLYRSIHEGRIDIHYNTGDLGLALELCENASNCIEYFKNLHKEISRNLLQSPQMIGLLKTYLQQNGIECVPYIQKALCNEPVDPKYLNQLQNNIPIIIVKILDFMHEDISNFHKGFPTIIANFLHKLLPSLDTKGKISIMKNFQFFLKIRHQIFIKLIEMGYTYYFNIISSLCLDQILEVRKEAALVAALMAIRFPSQQVSWTLFLDTLQTNPAVTQYLAETIDRHHLPDGFLVFDIPNRMALLFASNCPPFISCLRNNPHKFIGFLKNLSSSDTLSAKASAIIALSMITFNAQITCDSEKESAINLIQNELDKDEYLPQKIINMLSNSFFHINITDFTKKLKITFPALEK